MGTDAGHRSGKPRLGPSQTVSPIGHLPLWGQSDFVSRSLPGPHSSSGSLFLLKFYEFLEGSWPSSTNIYRLNSGPGPVLSERKGKWAGVHPCPPSVVAASQETHSLRRTMQVVECSLLHRRSPRQRLLLAKDPNQFL